MRATFAAGPATAVTRKGATILQRNTIAERIATTSPFFRERSRLIREHSQEIREYSRISGETFPLRREYSRNSGECSRFNGEH